MNPSKNRYYCPSAGRAKMLFDTEKQANNFIKFNKDEMSELSGKVPVRSYYCEYCCGWHLTSNPDADYFATHRTDNEKAIENGIRIIRDYQHLKKLKIFNRAQDYFADCDYFRAAEDFVVSYNNLKVLLDYEKEASDSLKKAYESISLYLKSLVENIEDNEFLQKLNKADKFISRLSEIKDETLLFNNRLYYQGVRQLLEDTANKYGRLEM